MAGSIGPTRTTLSLSPDVNNPGQRTHTFEQIAAGYYQQIEGLVEGGIDLLVETAFDTLTLKACLYAVQEFFDRGGRRVPLMIVGGCCGTTPDHIAAIARAVRGAAPRTPASPPPHSRYSGMEPLVLRPESNFTMVGERTNITGSRRFARLIRDGDYELPPEWPSSRSRGAPTPST